MFLTRVVQLSLISDLVVHTLLSLKTFLYSKYDTVLIVLGDLSICLWQLYINFKILTLLNYFFQ